MTDGEWTRCGITNGDKDKVEDEVGAPSAQDISMVSSVGQLWGKKETDVPLSVNCIMLQQETIHWK